MSQTLQQRLIVLSIFLLICMGVIAFKDPILTAINSRSEKKFPMELKNVKTISIQNETDTVSLEKTNDGWVVTQDKDQYPADNERIQSILTALETISLNDVASNNKEKHAELGISASKVATFSAGSQSTRLYVGNSTGSTQVARFNDESEVYRLSQLPDMFTPIEYRNLAIKPVTTAEDVSAFTIEFGKTAVNAQKKDGTWTENGKELSNALVSSWISSFASLTATDIQKTEKKPTDNPILSISYTEKGTKKSLIFYPNTDKDTNMMIYSGESKYRYSISTATVDSLKKSQSDLIEKS